MFLLQPQTNDYDKYLSLAKSEALGFELMDFAFPAVLDNRAGGRRVVARLKDAPVHSLHGVFIDINYSGGDPRIFKISKMRIEQCAKYAVMLNARKIVIHSCFFPVLTKDDVLYKLWSEESANLLCQIADKYTVEIFIENVLDITPDNIKMMLEYAGHEKIKVCLDIGHANFSRTPIEKWFDELHPYIKYIHLSDNMGMYDDHIALGDGTIDYIAVDGLLQKYNIKADYTIEVKGIENAKKSLDFINNNMTYLREQK